MHRILIVDQDEHLLWALEKNLFPERDDYELVTASEGEDAMEYLKEGDIDLLICDIKMPGEVDGFQLILRAKEIAPDARVIIMTAFGAGRIESFAERMGITHYIEKPFNISDLREMALDLFDEREGFQGMLSDLELTDIIQMLCLSNRSTVLHLKHKDHRGKIVFDRGKLVHAEFDNEEGVEAVYGMLALSQGDIFMESGLDYDERTIEVGWQDLLLEAAKRADEARLAEQVEQSEPVDDDDGTPFASFRPSESAEIELEEVASSGQVEVDDEAVEDGLEASSASSLDDASESEAADGLSEEDSFFTEEELEEIGMAGSAAIESSTALGKDERSEATGGAQDSVAQADSEPTSVADEGTDGYVDESSYGDQEADLEAARRAGAFDLGGTATSVDGAGVVSSQGGEVDGSLDEADSQSDPVDDGDGDELATDGGAPAGGTASDTTPAPENAKISGLLDDFAAECTGLKITGVLDLNGDRPTLLESHPAEGIDLNGALTRVRQVVDCADRVVGAVKNGVGAGEIQLVLEDKFVVLRRLDDQADYHHLAVVDRDASLGVVLVLMRQFAGDFASVLESQRPGE